MSLAAAAPTVDAAAAAAADARKALGCVGRSGRARALRAGAAALRAAPELVSIADEETHLGEARLAGEIERTATQAELFADVIEEGSYLDAAVDHAAAPGPDLRRLRVPLGPVAVFAAGNFPFAFGVFGGDTVSALAAGCPVVVKTHPDLPETSAATFRVVSEALSTHGLPAEALQLVTEPDAGRALVEAPPFAAVGFTGSTAGGRALFDAAAARAAPIPVFAEMSSINPTVVADEAARTEVETRAEQLSAAITSSAGQLCTKPGLVFVPADAGELISAIVRLLASTGAQELLSPNIAAQYAGRLDMWRGAGVASLVEGDRARSGVTPTLGITTLRELRGSLREEVFGPAALIVTFASLDDLPPTLRDLGGQLTTTVHAVGSDLELIDELLSAAAETSGRVVLNGVPTGVRVAWSTTHGGPYPASTQASSTSVGASAIDRWTRPVTWQNTPDRFLPDELRERPDSPVPRRVDGIWQ